VRELYVKIDEDSNPFEPVFIFSKDPHFNKPHSFMYFAVSRESPADNLRCVWSIERKSYSIFSLKVPPKVNRLKYAQAPDGYQELQKAIALQPNVVYRVSAIGGGDTTGLSFTIKKIGDKHRIEYELLWLPGSGIYTTKAVKQ